MTNNFLSQEIIDKVTTTMRIPDDKFNDYYLKVKNDIENSSDDLSYSIVDFRDFDEANEKGMLKNSIIIPKELPFEKYIGNFLSPYARIIAITNNDADYIDVLIRLKHLYYSQIVGFVNFQSLTENYHTELYKMKQQEEVKPTDNLIDVRDPLEWDEGVVGNDNTIYMKMLWVDYYWRKLDKSKTYSILCRGGVRSSIVTSYLNLRGINSINVTGGTTKLLKQGMKFISKI